MNDDNYFAGLLPDRKVYFQQEHPPGREAQVDFTHCGELGVTMGGEPFRHLLFHLVLSHSGWSYAEVCFGETFGALVKGLQGAFWELECVPGWCVQTTCLLPHTT